VKRGPQAAVASETGVNPKKFQVSGFKFWRRRQARCLSNAIRVNPTKSRPQGGAKSDEDEDEHEGEEDSPRQISPVLSVCIGVYPW
jgi:hypothetical protein